MQCAEGRGHPQAVLAWENPHLRGSSGRTGSPSQVRAGVAGEWAVCGRGARARVGAVGVPVGAGGAGRGRGGVVAGVAGACWTG